MITSTKVDWFNSNERPESDIAFCILMVKHTIRNSNLTYVLPVMGIYVYSTNQFISNGIDYTDKVSHYGTFTLIMTC